jgi:hypothetical protein
MELGSQSEKVLLPIRVPAAFTKLTVDFSFGKSQKAQEAKPGL